MHRGYPGGRPLSVKPRFGTLQMETVRFLGGVSGGRRAMRSEPVAALGREAKARGAFGPWRAARADHCAGRLRLLLASSSLAALLIGSGAPAALAAPNCKTIQSGGSVAAVSNSSPTGNCILIENGANVTGNVINTSTGVLTTNGTGIPSQTGITISNSTVGGSVSNAGKIVAQSQ